MDVHGQLSPQRRLTNPAAEFIENRVKLGGTGAVSYVGELDTFLDEPDVKAQEAKSQALWNDVEAEKNRLFEAIQAAKTKWSKKFPAMGLIHLHACTWAQVMDEFAKAEEHYRGDSANGPRGKIKRYLRKLGDSAPVFERWIGLLPAGDYGSGICGAFRFVLGAASRLQDIRECVYEALSDIPEAIRQAQKYVEIYKKEEPFRLKQETVSLYRVILITLQHILGFFTRTAGSNSPHIPQVMIITKNRDSGRALNALVHQENYEEILTRSVQEVKDRSVKIKDLAVECSQERQKKMDEKLNQIWESQQLMKEVFENLHRHLLSHPILDRSTREPITNDENGNNPTEVLAKKLIGMNPVWLVDLLDFNVDCPSKDIATCRAMSGTMGDAAKDRASFVANSRKLQLWLTEATKSQALIINGDFKQDALTSPFSFLCAEISHLYGSVQNTYVMTYFCGLHSDSWRNPRANARGMMISLVGQLLSSNRSFDLSFIDKKLIREVKDDSIRALCRIFRRLVLQLPEETVLFCCIDTISIYETSDRLEETRFAIRTITRLLAAKKRKATFKLLITSSGQSLDVKAHLNEEDILSVPHYIDGSRQGVVDLRKIQRKELLN